MDALVRSTTRNFSRRVDGYEPIEINSESTGYGDHMYRRNMSKRKKLQPHGMVKTFSYRRDRARQRQIFLKSYTLTSMENLGKSGSGRLKKVAIKVKAVAVSVVAFIRMNSLRSCNSRSAMAASSPTTSVRKCFSL